MNLLATIATSWPVLNKRSRLLRKVHYPLIKYALYFLNLISNVLNFCPCPLNTQIRIKMHNIHTRTYVDNKYRV